MKQINEFFKKYTVYGLFLLLVLSFGVVVYAGDVSTDSQSRTNTRVETTQGDTGQSADALADSEAGDSKSAPAATDSGLVTAFAPEGAISATDDTKLPKKKLIVMSVEGMGDYKVEIGDGENSFEVLKRTADMNYFDLDYSVYTFDGISGAFVNSINGRENNYTSSYYWTLYYNGEMAQTGASQVTLKDGDVINWKYENLTW